MCLRTRVILGVVSAHTDGVIEDSRCGRFQLVPVRRCRLSRLGRRLQTLQSLVTVLARLSHTLLRGCTSRRGLLDISNHGQCLKVAGVHQQHLLPRLDGLGNVVRLLVGTHQKFKRVFLIRTVGKLRHKSFKAADLCRRVGLVRGAHVGVVLGWVFHLFLRRRRLGWRRRGWRCALRHWRSTLWHWRSTLRHRRGSGLSDGGNRGYQQHRENDLLHSYGSLTLRGKREFYYFV